MIKFKFFIFVFLTFVLLSFNNFAAEITGTIVNKANNEKIENVIIRAKESNSLTLTDKDGKFTLKTKSKVSQIMISCVGYKSEIINIKDGNYNLGTIELNQQSVLMSEIVVTAKNENSVFDKLSDKVNTVEGKELQKNVANTIAATLKNEVGVAIRSMGQAPARPVIRGLGGNRLMINEDGMQVNDLSATSPDHAVTVEPFTVEKIEVVRGPKVLLSSPSAIGGLINIEMNNIPVEIPKRIKATGGIYTESGNKAFEGALSTEIPVDDFCFKAEGSHKNTGDMRTPDGVLKNTTVNTNTFSLGSSYKIPDFLMGASINEYSNDYGIPGGFIGGHPKGVNIEMFKRVINVKSMYHLDQSFLDNIEADFSRTYYRHKEFESNNSLGAEFVLRDYMANLKFNHNPISIFSGGTFGLSYHNKDLEMGGYVFTPPTDYNNLALFDFEEINTDSWAFQFSARYDYSAYKPRIGNPSTDIGMIREREFNTYSVAISVIKSLSDYTHLGFNATKSSRPPSTEELYSEGPHLAAYSYEVGNPNLKAEDTYGFEIYGFYKNEDVFGMLTLFANEMPYFIIPRNTGKINLQQILPIYATTGVNAEILGIESQIEFNLAKNLTFKTTLSYNYGQIIDEDSPLPSMPPMKCLIDLRYANLNYLFGVSSEIASAQNRVDKFEDPTKGYCIFNSYYQQTFQFGKQALSLSLTLDNIFDTVYRNHLSRIKSIMPESGRNLRLFVKFFI